MTPGGVENEETMKNNKLVAFLSCEVIEKDMHIQALESEYQERTVSLKRMMEQREQQLQSYSEEIQEMRERSDEHTQKFDDESKKLRLEILELDARSKQLKELVAQTDCNLELEKQRATQGFPGQTIGRAHIGIRMIGELDLKAFADVCRQKFPKDVAEVESVKLCSKWQNEISNPNWHPFVVATVNGKESAKQLIYSPRHVSLQRISAILRMPITNVGMRSESAGRRARLIVCFPPAMPGGQYESHEFIGDIMPTEFAAIEDVAGRALDFLRTVKHVDLDDANYRLRDVAEQKLAMAESLHALHMEVAQQAQQLTESLIHEAEQISHAHDTLLWLNADLQQQNEARENQQAQVVQQLTLQNGVLTQEKAALQQQCALMAQQMEALTQKNIAQGQDLENTNLQLQLNLQANVALHQTHVALQQAYAVMHFSLTNDT